MSNLLTKGLNLNLLNKLPIELSQSLLNLYEQNLNLNVFNSFISPQEAVNEYELLPTKGKLKGIPIGIKDIFCTIDLPTTASSKMLKDYKSPFEATVITKLKSEGGIIIGKTNMDEFGMGSSNLNSYFGPTINPLSSTIPGQEGDRVAGGSSGGSAAAVASGMCRIALGSDTGGSTRLPASYCGIIGFKPSFGLISRFGMISYASSLDCVGIMSKSIQDVRLTLDVLSEYDEKDPTSISNHARERAKLQEKDWSTKSGITDLRGIKIGIPVEYFLKELSPSVIPNFKKVLLNLKSMGATLISVSLPSIPNSLGAYYVIASAEACSNLARYDGLRFGTRIETDSIAIKSDNLIERKPLYSETRSSGFGKEVQKRLLLGTFALSAEAFDNYFLQAQRVRHLIQLEFNDIFSSPHPLHPLPSFHTSFSSPSFNPNTVDVLLHPSSISTAPLISSSFSSSDENKNSTYVQDILNVPASLAGLPALSIPVGKSEEDGLPVAIQIVGQWGSEDLVLRIGEAILVGEGC